MKNLVEELYDVRVKWLPIGIELRMQQGTLKEIEYNYKNDVEGALMEMVYAWLCQDLEASWPNIVKALRSVIVEEPALASEIEKKWCPLPQTTTEVHPTPVTSS